MVVTTEKYLSLIKVVALAYDASVNEAFGIIKEALEGDKVSTELVELAVMAVA